MMNQKEKPLAWLGGSKKDLMTLPAGVRKFFGHALDFAQRVALPWARSRSADTRYFAADPGQRHG